MSGRARPSLALDVEIEKPSGEIFEWKANDRLAGNRPLGLNFTTKLMEGFSTGGVNLARRAASWLDLAIYDTIRFVADDGRVAYEGRGSAFPATLADTKRIAAQSVGWINHASDRPVIPFYVDRDATKFGPVSNTRLQFLQGLGRTVYDPVQQSDSDGAVVSTEFTQDVWTTAAEPNPEAVYVAPPGVKLASIYYEWTLSNIDPTDTNWEWVAGLADDVALTGLEFTANLRSAGPGTGTFDATAATRTVALLHLAYLAAGGTDGDNITRAIWWRNVAVYGLTGLPPRGAAPGGFTVADMIRHGAGAWCPLLDASGVQDSPHIVDQAMNADLINPYDWWITLNAYERWLLAVWENRRLCYSPPPSGDDYEWEVRQGEDGVQIAPNGQTSEATCNGVIVRFQDVTTDIAAMISPDDTPELADTNPMIAANQAGIRAWQPVQLPNPNSPAGAARIGQLILQELNAQAEPLTITVPYYIRDMAGEWHAGHEPRVGERVVIANADDDRPRLITATEWDGDSKMLTLTTDGEEQTVDAILDQINTDAMARTR